MPTLTDITNLKINKLTEAQYDTAVQGGVIGENELSVLTDVELEQIQRTTLPTASGDELGNIYQFVGTTDANYTNGYFYKCVSDGATPTPTYSWARVDVQPGSSLPSQVYQGGKYLKTDGTNLSWDYAIKNIASNSSSIAIGPSTTVNGSNITLVGESTSASGEKTGACAFGWGADAAGGAIAIGYQASASALWAIQLGGGSNGIATNSDARTFKVSNGSGNYEMMSADGTIPADRTSPITTISSATVTQALANNYIYNCTVDMTSIEITLPATLTANFCSQLNFTSGSTPTAFTSPVGMIWMGDDVSTTFVPVANKRYAIMVFFDGVLTRGIVQAA